MYEQSAQKLAGQRASPQVQRSSKPAHLCSRTKNIVGRTLKDLDYSILMNLRPQPDYRLTFRSPSHLDREYSDQRAVKN